MDTAMFTRLCSALITIFFGVLLPYFFKLIKEKIGEIKLNQIIDMVNKSVEAAQQVIGKEHCEEKKKEVTEYVLNLVNNYNINLTEKDIDNLIEAAVFEMKNGIK